MHVNLYDMCFCYKRLTKMIFVTEPMYAFFRSGEPICVNFKMLIALFRDVWFVKNAFVSIFTFSYKIYKYLKTENRMKTR